MTLSTAPSSKASHYDALGVPKTATADEIKKAYRSLVVQCHPDKLIHASNSSDFDYTKASSEISLMISKGLSSIDLDECDVDCEDGQPETIEQSSSKSEKEISKSTIAFHEIHTAYECLRDLNKRIEYDQSLTRDEKRKEWKMKGATEVNLSDLESEMCCVVNEDGKSDNGGDQLQRVYFYLCRCGDTFEILEEELLDSTCSERVWQCESCSLGIKIHLDVDIKVATT